MSEVQVPAQVSASSYRSPVEPALSLKSELEAYDRDKDRRSLLGALKEQFLLNRLVAASQAENTRYLGLQILFNRIEHMSDKMLIKTVRVLSEIGALDLAAVTGTTVPVSEPPMVSIQQAFRLPGGGFQPLGDRSASNLLKDLLEAHEHITAHTQSIAILGLRFDVRWPYSAGHVCTKGEATALNQKRLQIIRNNLAVIAKDRALTQADVDAYAASYVFGGRIARRRTHDPVKAEALELARRLVRTKGQSRKENTQAARELLQSEKGDAIRAQAARRVLELKDLMVA
jgi:hypothetical protein